jgi:hypothetical protein
MSAASSNFRTHFVLHSPAISSITNRDQDSLRSSGELCLSSFSLLLAAD